MDVLGGIVGVVDDRDQELYGKYAEELIRFAQKEEIDVIVIGSTGKGFLKRKLLGSVSHKVVRDAKCSVYVVRG